jgi:hypothetical protein
MNVAIRDSHLSIGIRKFRSCLSPSPQQEATLTSSLGLFSRNARPYNMQERLAEHALMTGSRSRTTPTSKILYHNHFGISYNNDPGCFTSRVTEPKPHVKSDEQFLKMSNDR